MGEIRVRLQRIGLQPRPHLVVEVAIHQALPHLHLLQHPAVVQDLYLRLHLLLLRSRFGCSPWCPQLLPCRMAERRPRQVLCRILEDLHRLAHRLQRNVKRLLCHYALPYR